MEIQKKQWIKMNGKDLITKKRINGVLILFCVIKITVVALSVLYPYLIKLLSPSTPVYKNVIGTLTSSSNISGLLFSIGLYIVGVGVPVILYFALSKKNKPADAFVLTGKPTLLQTAYAVGATVFLSQTFSAIYNVVVELLRFIFGKETNILENITEASSPTNFWIILVNIIYLSVLPAFFEEFSIRGAFLRETNKFGRVSVILLSGLFFMMLHNNVEQWGLAFSAGVLMAYFTLKFRSIWVAVISHFAINLNSAIISYFIGEIDIRNFTLSYLIYYIIYFSLMVALMIAGLIIFGIKLPDIGAPTKEEKKGKLKLIFSSPFFYIFVFLFIFSAIIVVFNIF